MRQPLVSVVMATFNGARLLPRAIASILEQTFSDLEFIIIDDGSTDDSQTILSEAATKDDRVIVLSNKRNLGLTRSLNKGLHAARGTYIARQDVDDISLPERLEQQIIFLDANENVGLVGSWAHREVEGKPPQLLVVPTRPHVIRWTLLFHNSFFHSSTVFRRHAVELVGPYCPSIRYAQDYELWLRINTVYDSMNLARPLILLGSGPDRITSKHNDSQQTTALDVSQGALSELFKANVSRSIVSDISRTRLGLPLQSGEAVTRVTHLIASAHHHFLRRFSPEPDEVREINQDTANKLLSLATQNFKTSIVSSAQAMLLAMRLDPRLPSMKSLRQVITPE